MTFDELEHAIRAACNIADDNEVWVFGSQAILASFRNPPGSLTASIEVDVEPVHRPGPRAARFSGFQAGRIPG